jgi:hypothetical protein
MCLYPLRAHRGKKATHFFHQAMRSASSVETDPVFAVVAWQNAVVGYKVLILNEVAAINRTHFFIVECSTITFIAASGTRVGIIKVMARNPTFVNRNGMLFGVTNPSRDARMVTGLRALSRP